MHSESPETNSGNNHSHDALNDQTALEAPPQQSMSNGGVTAGPKERKYDILTLLKRRGFVERLAANENADHTRSLIGTRLRKEPTSRISHRHASTPGRYQTTSERQLGSYHGNSPGFPWYPSVPFIHQTSSGGYTPNDTFNEIDSRTGIESTTINGLLDAMRYMRQCRDYQRTCILETVGRPLRYNIIPATYPTEAPYPYTWPNANSCSGMTTVRPSITPGSETAISASTSEHLVQFVHRLQQNRRDAGW